MNFIKAFLGVFIVLVSSRYIPHPPNYTSLIALSFYIPAFFGQRYIYTVLISFIISDLLIFGTHNLIAYTWGSVLLIGYLPKYFKRSIPFRFIGALSGSLIFFIVTNFGVWTTGFYGLNFFGLVNCYFLALPFFQQTIISTIVYSSIIEALYLISSNFLKREVINQKKNN